MDGRHQPGPAGALNTCGECGACCKLLGIETLGKPAGPWCEHFFEGGCRIYDDRPDECRGFHCAWLKSQRLPPEARMGPEWRPDRAGFVMYTDRGGLRLNVVVEPADPLAWRREPYHGYLKRISRRSAEGHELVVYVGERRILVLPDEDVELEAAAPGLAPEPGSALTLLPPGPRGDASPAPERAREGAEVLEPQAEPDLADR